MAAASTERSWTDSSEVASLDEELFEGDGMLFKLLVCLLGVIGMVGNVVVLIIMIENKKTRKQITGRLIINQSLVDFCCALSIILTYGYNLQPVRRYNKGGREALCYLLVDKILLFNSMNASTYSLMVITIERYMMIVTPIFHRNHFTRNRAMLMVVVAWLAGYLWNTPATLLTTSVHSDGGQCVPFAWNDLEAQKNFGISYVTATFFFPMLIFAMAYSHMGWVLKKRAVQLGIEPQATGTTGAAGKKTKLTKGQVNITKTMVLVTTAFAVCWTPNQVWYLMFNLGYGINLSSTGYLLTLFLSFINSCINPCIYAFKLEAFKQGLVKHLQCLPACRKSRSDESQTQTGTSNNSHL